jgi:ABC-type Na+ efflux pump permease subunit
MYGKLLGAVMVALSVVAVPALALADASQSIVIESPNIDWASIPTQIMSALTTPVIVGIGIALSIWVIFAGINFFRRSSRA